MMFKVIFLFSQQYKFRPTYIKSDTAAAPDNSTGRPKKFIEISARTNKYKNSFLARTIRD